MIEKCKKCGHEPRVVKITDLYYAKCSNPACKKWDPHAFIGITEKKALEHWNMYNSDNYNKQKDDYYE